MTVLSRQLSAGSLSGEGDGDWAEEAVSASEQQLLEQCITSGMPRTKNVIGPSVGAAPADVDARAVTIARTEPRDIMKVLLFVWRQFFL